jgi:hypothetical protein
MFDGSVHPKNCVEVFIQLAVLWYLIEGAKDLE